MATETHSNRAHVQVGLTANVGTFFTQRDHAEVKQFCKPYWSRRVVWAPSLKDGNAEAVHQFQPRVTPWEKRRGMRRNTEGVGHEKCDLGQIASC